MKIPKQARREAKGLLRNCLVHGQLDPGRVRQAVQQVIALKPRRYLAVLTHFKRLVKLEVQRRSARVESPIRLSAEVAASVQNRLTQVYGEGLEMAFAENPDLIGGLRIRVGSDVFDGSIRGRLAALRESMG